MRIVKLEGLALFLLVSSTGYAGLPAHFAHEVVDCAAALTPRLRDEVTLRPATAAAVDLALFELLGRGERAVEELATLDLPALIVAVVVDTNAVYAAAQTTRLAAEPQAFRGSQHGPFDDLIFTSAVRFRVNPFLLKGLLANESKLEPVRAGKRHYALVGGRRTLVAGGAAGIAQFSGGGVRGVRALRRARRRRGERTLDFDFQRAVVPQEAIPAAAELLAHLIRRYGHDGGVTAYNSGVVGGLAVSRLGFWNARKSGKLERSGIFHIQGHRFLLNVLRETNRYRAAAGLPPFAPPQRPRRTSSAARLPLL